jgi:putative NADH-flavin reductase
MNPVAVLGGTGKAGTYLVEKLLSEGYTVKALARIPSKLPEHDRLIKVQGDATDAAAIRTLLEDCDAVISTLGPSKSTPDTCSIAVKHLVEAMQEKGISRYLEVAGLAINTPDDRKGFRTRLIVAILKSFFPAVINDRQKGYELLLQSKLDWTIVRCPMIRLTGTEGTVRTDLLDSPGNHISATDLAGFLIQQLNDLTYAGKAPFIAN